MEFVLIISLIALCIYGFAEQEHNFQALEERINSLEEMLQPDKE